jgi:hypothetical protein
MIGGAVGFMQRKLALRLSPRATAVSSPRRAAAAVLAAASALVILFAGGPARADSAKPPIVLVLDPCAAVDAEQVRRLVPIEMGAPLAPAAGEGTAAASGDGGRADTTHVFVGCVPGSPQLVRLEVRDPESGRRVDRVITLVGDSKTDQARLVAIVAVELVATSRSELREPAPPSVATPAPDVRALAVTARPAPPPAQPSARWRALALGSLRRFGGLPQLLPGGGLSVERVSPHGFVLSGDAFAEGGVVSTALGDVEAFVGSLGVLAGGRLERGRLAGEAAVGARGGMARLAGESPRGGTAGPVQLGTQSAPWAGPLVAARAQATVGQRVVLSLGGELGYVTSAVAGRVTGHPDIAVSGAWWNLVFGVGYAP